MKKIILMMLAGSLLMLNSCTKSGPQGPQGAQGPQGNANVLGAQPFSVINWNFASNVYSATFTDADITSDIVNTGVVEVYKQYPDGSWTNLPDINGVVTTVYNFYEGGFVISVLTTDGSVTPAPGTVTFRTVIISSSQRQANPNTNWKNYNEALTAINSTAAATTTAATH